MNERDQVVPMDNQTNKPGPRLARRSFLMAAPLGALAVVAGRASQQQPLGAAAAPQPTAKRGYHETEHIRRYYRTASYW